MVPWTSRHRNLFTLLRISPQSLCRVFSRYPDVSRLFSRTGSAIGWGQIDVAHVLCAPLIDGGHGGAERCCSGVQIETSTLHMLERRGPETRSRKRAFREDFRSAQAKNKPLLGDSAPSGPWRRAPLAGSVPPPRLRVPAHISSCLGIPR